jgi:uncharacterized protein (TIGR03435 family)
MANAACGNLSVRVSVAIALLGIGAIAPIKAKATPQSPSVSATLAFEVASIKRNRSGTGNWRVKGNPAGLTATNTTPQQLVIFAYALRNFEISRELNDQIVGEPDWMSSERYDVSASAGRTVTPEEVRAMVRSLLQERFKMAAHRETKLRQTYALMLARPDRILGPELRRTDVDCQAVAAANAAFVGGLQPRPKPASNGVSPCALVPAEGTLNAGGVPIETLARSIAKEAGRTVVDKTGLTGNYEFKLKYSPAGNSAADDRPTIFIALREQLGLKLEPQQNPLDVLVIDRIERPTAN